MITAWQPYVVWSLLTVVAYWAARHLYLRHSRWWTSPLLTAPLALMLLMTGTHVGYGEYSRGTHWLMAMLGPATVAFAVPIYEHRALLKRYWPILLLGTLVGSTVSLASAWLLAQGLHLPPELQRSLLPRSVTTPFAVTVAGRVGGLPDLTAALVVMTGVCGAAIGRLLLKHLRLHSGVARGALFGMGAHGAGVASAREVGVEEGTVAGLVMVLAGLLNLAMVPLLVWLLR